MKRPSGFDRDPEPRRGPQPERAAGADDGFIDDVSPVDAPIVDLSAVSADLADYADLADHSEISQGAHEPDSREQNAHESVAHEPVAAEQRPVSILAPESDDAPALAPTPEPAESGLRAAERNLKEAVRGRKRRERREQKRFTWHVRRRRRPWLIAGAAIVLVAVFVLVGVFTPLMGVREIQIEGANRVDAAEVVAALDSMQGTPLALVDRSEIHRALAPFPLIEQYAVETIPPHTLVVRLEERSPVLALPADSGLELVDPAGVTVEQLEAPPEGIPLAAGAAANRSTAAFQAVARVLRDLPADFLAQIATATAATGQDVTFTLHSGVEVVWGEADETPRKAVVIAAMLRALGDRPVSLIDVSSSEAPIFR